MQGFGPQWQRPFPPRFPVQDDELVWLNLVDCHDTNRGTAIRDLITKALKEPLAPTQQEVSKVMDACIRQRMIIAEMEE